jgi:3-methyladenine DNA glycosylase AlkC
MITDSSYFDQFFNKETGKEHYQLCRKDAETYAMNHTVDHCFETAIRWYGDDTYYIQMWAVYLMGKIAAHHPSVMSFLKDVVSHNPSWQVQEALAMAFDDFCKVNGYGQSLPVIKAWLSDGNANVRRAVTEGLRIWTSRPYFKEHPTEAVRILSTLKQDESGYVRKSVGNALRDISKRHPDLIRDELRSWALDTKEIIQVHKLAGKLVLSVNVIAIR